MGERRWRSVVAEDPVMDDASELGGHIHSYVAGVAGAVRAALPGNQDVLGVGFRLAVVLLKEGHHSSDSNLRIPRVVAHTQAHAQAAFGVAKGQSVGLAAEQYKRVVDILPTCEWAAVPMVGRQTGKLAAQETSLEMVTLA